MFTTLSGGAAVEMARPDVLRQAWGARWRGASHEVRHGAGGGTGLDTFDRDGCMMGSACAGFCWVGGLMVLRVVIMSAWVLACCCNR